MVDVVQVYCRIKEEQAMFTIEISDGLRTTSKDFAYKANAVKSATRIKEAGYVLFDNPELWPWQRKVVPVSICVYDSNDKDTCIIIM